MLDQILEQQAHLKDLVVNGWIHIISLGADGKQWLKRQADGSWTPRPKLAEVRATI